MSLSETDRIERQILLRVPRSRVWRALTDPVEFGTWFGVKVGGTFAPGARVRGQITHSMARSVRTTSNTWFRNA